MLGNKHRCTAKHSPPRARNFEKSAISRHDLFLFFENPNDDEYVFNVINFKVGRNIVSFYILLKRLEEGGNQFARLLPGRICQLGRVEGYDYQSPPKSETIFIRQRLKLPPRIMDPRIYGFSIGIGPAGGFSSIPLLQEAADVFGQSCSGGLMGKFDGDILLPAVVSQDGIVSGFLVTLSQMGTSKMFCVLVKYQPWVEIPARRIRLKYFVREAAQVLCSTYSISDMSTELKGMQVPNLGDSWIVVPMFTDYTLDRGRVLVGLTMKILEH
jgi:hypothetical protein